MKYSERDQLQRMTGKELVALYNKITDGSLKKFTSRDVAIRRIIGLLPGKDEKPEEKKVEDKKSDDKKSDDKKSKSKKAKKFGKNDTITVEAEENPKRKGSQSYDRFELYTKFPNVIDFLVNGGKTADITWDLKHGFISIVEGE